MPFSFAKTNTTNTTQNWSDSYNTSMSKNDIVADSGNTTVYLNSGEAEAANAAGKTTLQKYLPLIALVMFGLAALLWLTSGNAKPWQKNGLSL